MEREVVDRLGQGPCLADANLQVRSSQRVSRMRGFRQWQWHLDKMYVRLNSEMVYLSRAVDQEGEVLESYVTKTRRSAALAEWQNLIV